MRVLICSYSPQTVTSYGIIVRELWSRLAKTRRWEIAQHAWFHAPSLPPAGWQIFPTSSIVKDEIASFDPKDEFGQKSCEQVIQKFQPDIVWCLSDIYMSQYLDRLKNAYGFKLIRWTLSAGDPLRKADIDSVQAADECVGVTRYSTALWKNVTGKDYRHIYHGVDLNVFKPVSKEKRDDLRKDFLKDSPVPIGGDDFGILYVGRNQNRKRPWLLFQVLHYLLSGNWGWKDGQPVLGEWNEHLQASLPPSHLEERARPIPAFLWMHSYDDGSAYAYRDLSAYWGVSQRVFFTANLSHVSGLLPNAMASIYQACDVLSMMSGSEGFGVPLIEAAACGIPSVYTDYAGSGEIGRLCSGRPIPYVGWEPAKRSTLRWVHPDVARGVEAFYRIYEQRTQYGDPLVKDRIRKPTEKNFDWEAIAVEWQCVLEEVSGRESRRLLGGEV